MPQMTTRNSLFISCMTNRDRSISKFIFIGVVMLQSCQGCRNESPQKHVDYAHLEERLIQENIGRVAREQEVINGYINKNGWPMSETRTGLRYWLMEDKEGVLAEPGQMAVVNFNIELLDGTKCYSSEENGPFAFRVAEDQVETGLHEGIQMMSQGDVARFIIPSHLAWGITGDHLKIPSNATLVYDVELTQLN